MQGRNSDELESKGIKSDDLKIIHVIVLMEWNWEPNSLEIMQVDSKDFDNTVIDHVILDSLMMLSFS